MLYSANILTNVMLHSEMAIVLTFRLLAQFVVYFYPQKLWMSFTLHSSSELPDIYRHCQVVPVLSS